VKDELPRAGGGVDVLVQRPEADAALLEQADRLDEVAEGTTDTVELPDHQRQF
jgi:hypothetical protein